MTPSSQGKRDGPYYGRKHIARESLCAFFCDDAALQKSSALKISNAIAVEQISLDVLYSIVRGEPPSCMPSFSLSKGAFLPKEDWLHSSPVMNSIEVQMGANTLRACLQSPRAWERARVIALRALLLYAAADPRRLDDLLPHLLMGLKANPEKQLSYCSDTVIHMALMYVTALPKGDNFVFSVIQVALSNEEVKIPVIKRVVSRAVDDLSLLVKVRNILERIQDSDITTPVYGVLHDVPSSSELGMFSIAHYCNINVECLTEVASLAISVIDRHISHSSPLKLVLFVTITVRLLDIHDVYEQGRCLKFLKDRLDADSPNSYAKDLSEAVIRYPNIFRIAIDAIVTAGIHANMAAEPVYEFLYLSNLLLDLQLRATSVFASNGKLPALSMDLSSLLKVREFSLHLTHCGFAFENDSRLEPLLTSINETLTSELVAKYASQFEYDRTAELNETNIWADISDLVGNDHGLGLFVAVKRRIQSAADIVWAFNSVQMLYCHITLAQNYEYLSAAPNIHGFPVLLKDEWCLRDAMKVSMALLTGNVTLHASALSYISSISARRNEMALFFVSSLVESSLALFRLSMSMPDEIIMNLIEMNITMLARISRHRLTLPVIYSAFKYIFGHNVAKICFDTVPAFYLFDARWKCLLLRNSEIPSSKVIDNISSDAIAAMSAREREIFIIIFRSLCMYRPDDAVKYVNEISGLLVEFPAHAIEGCARICKNDVMDFGVAYSVYIAPVFQEHSSDKAVVNAVGSFFCDYLQYLSARIQGPISDEDVVDLNVILPTLTKLTALKDLNGVTAMAALLKSPLWAKLETIKKWHINQECDCYSLLDRIKKRRLQCTYAKLNKEFFEFDFTSLINADSIDEDGKDISHSHCHSLLVSGFLDAENDATSRVDLLSRRNDTVLEFNREIRKATKELIRLFSNSNTNVQEFSWFLEDEEQEKMVGGIRIKSSGGTNQKPKGIQVYGSAAGIGYVRWIHLSSLFKLYATRLKDVQVNLNSVCEGAYGAVVTEGAGVTGKFLSDVALLANVPDDENSMSMVKHMLIHLKEVSESIGIVKGFNDSVNSQKAVVFALALSYMHCRHCIVTEFPLVVLRMLRVALQKMEACPDLVEALYLVMGDIYRYTHLHFNMTEDFVNLFTEYLQYVHDRPLGLGWVLGLINFIEDIPRSSIDIVSVLLDRVMDLIQSHELPARKRALLTIPLLQYWALNRSYDVTHVIVQQLMEIQPLVASAPEAMFLIAYCHYMDFHLQTDGSVISGGRLYAFKGENSTGFDERVDGLYGNQYCKEMGEIGGSCGGASGTHVEQLKMNDKNNISFDGKVNNHVNSTFKGSCDVVILPNPLQENLLSCINLYVNGTNEEKDILLMASMVAHKQAYLVPPRTECQKSMLKHKRGWYPLYKELMDALSAIARKDRLQVTIMSAPKMSRYGRMRSINAVSAGASGNDGTANGTQNRASDHWGDESAALAAVLQLDQIKGFLMQQSDLDCYRDDGNISYTVNALKQNPHSFNFLSALTLCKPLKLTLWDVVSFEETECNCERELVLRIYCLHGQANRPLLKRMAMASKYFSTFEKRLKLSFLNCLRLSFWSIDFNSLRMILAYIADFDDLDVLLAIETLLESCIYLLKGADGAGINDEIFASQVLSKLLHPVIVQVVSRSKHYKASLCLYRKAMLYFNDEQRRELALAVDTSDIALKCVLCGICKEGEEPLTFNECFAHLVSNKVSIRDIVLYCYVNLHRHLDVMLHSIHVLNVNKNEQIILVVLTMMALVAERNVSTYLLELAFDGCSKRANAREELLHFADLDVYEFLRMNRQSNLLYYDTMDPKTLVKSAGIVAIAPGMWKNCGLEATSLGSLMPMARGRMIPTWLPKLGNISLDRRRQALLPMRLPGRHFESSANEVMAEHLLVDSTVVIMSAYKAYLLEHHMTHTGLRDVTTFINSRII